MGFSYKLLDVQGGRHYYAFTKSKEIFVSFILNKLDSINKNTIDKEEDTSMLSKENDLNNANANFDTSKKNDSLLSADAVFSGSISFKSFLRIDGQFEGEIHSKGTLFIGKTGVVKAEIKVGNIIVEGKIQGNVQAEDKIDLRQTAQLFGDIKAKKLVIAEGVSFVGHCNVNPNNEKVELTIQKEDFGPAKDDKKNEKKI